MLWKLFEDAVGSLETLFELPCLVECEKFPEEGSLL